MSELPPCPDCQRHVRKTETSCPFCGQALALSDLPAAVLPRSRLGRAATFAFGATLASATALVACGGESEGKKESAGGTASGGAGAGQSPGGTGIAPPYGVPAGGTENDTGGTGFGVGLVYGAPSVSDGGDSGDGGVPPK